MVRRDGWSVNAKRVRRVMHELGLAAEPVKRRVRTTNSDHPFPRYPNLVADLAVTRPDQVWVADITYVRVRSEFVYLAVLMDVFTRVIRGWELSRSLNQGLTLTALSRAVRRDPPGIHHSDQGVRYAATAYVERLTAIGAVISMAAVGVPEENGFAERLMRTIKTEPTKTGARRTRCRAEYNSPGRCLPVGPARPGPLLSGVPRPPRRIRTMSTRPATAPPRARTPPQRPNPGGRTCRPTSGRSCSDASAGC
jgi:transposase InsO family protein